MALIALAPAYMIGQIKQEEYWQPIENSRMEIDRANPEIRNLILRWEEIGNDLRTTTNPLAGTYEQWGYRGWFLRWSPGKGFVYVFHSEGLSIIDFSYGRVSTTSEAIVFDPEREMKETFRSKRLSLPRKWIPIRLADGAYLVPEERIKDFGNYAGGFGEYNDFNGPCCEFSPFFFKPNETGSAARSTLVVPPTYQRFIRQPINAEIRSIGRKRFARNYGLDGELYSHLFLKASLISVVINAGSRQGVKRNELFRLIGQPRSQFLRIVSVQEKASRGVVIRDRDDDGRETYFEFVAGMKDPQRKSFPPVHPGTKVTTSPVLDF
jgi:hypothetical protein